MEELNVCDTWYEVMWLGGKIKIRLGLMDLLQAWSASQKLWSDKLHCGEAWARLDADGPKQRWRASEVKIDEPIRWCDDKKWIISLRKIKPSVDSWWWSKGLIKVGACVASTLEEMKWNAQGKGITYRAFHFTGVSWVEKCLTRFRIDSRTIKRPEKYFSCNSYLVPLSVSFICICIALSDVVRCMRKPEKFFVKSYLKC
jgi:hypothetical protein